MEPITRIKIENSDIFLEQLGEGRGKITISDTYNHNYSYFWGAMGGTLQEFICSINAGYFADKLLGSKSNYEMDVPGTFAAIRKFIAVELGLPFYKHMEFQKQLRETLNEFQRECDEYPNQNHFVDRFYSSFINRLDFYLIKDRWDKESVEKDFKGISECWNLISEKPSKEYLWLEKLHKKLKVALLKVKINAELKTDVWQGAI